MSSKTMFENKVVPMSKIVVDGDWPVDSALIASMDEKGLLQPVILIELGDKLYLRDGRSRHACARRLGWESMEARVARVSLLSGDMLALSGNIRAGNPLSEARAIKRLGDAGMGSDDLRLYSGKNITSRGRLLSLLKLSPDLQKMIETGEMTLGAGYALAKLDSHENQVRALAEAVVESTGRRAAVADVEYAVADVLHAISPTLPLPPPVSIDARGDRFTSAILVEALRQRAARMPEHRAKVLEKAAQEIEKEAGDE